MKLITEKEIDKAIEYVAYIQLQEKIDKAKEYIKEDINYWQDSIYVELKAEDFIEILNKYLEILGGEENENNNN